MSIIWEQGIKHFNRPVRRLAARRARKTLRQLELRKRRGMPSRPLSSEAVDDGLRQWHEFLSPEQLAQIKVLKERRLIRSWLLERKLQALGAIRARRVTEQKTCINLWRRRRMWLSQVEEMFADMPADYDHSKGFV